MSKIENITANRLNNKYNSEIKRTDFNKTTYITKEDIAAMSKQIEEQSKIYDNLLEHMGSSNFRMYKIAQKTKIILKNFFKNLFHKPM